MRAFVVLSFVALSACGGGSIVSTGLPRDQALNSLTAAEIKTACTNTLNTQVLTDAEITGVCAAQLLPKGQAACTQGLAQCVTESKASFAQNTASKSCDDMAASNALSSCSATVGELEDCLSSVVEYVADRYGSVTCDSPQPPSGKFDPYHQPGCSTLNTKCPTLFGTNP